MWQLLKIYLPKITNQFIVKCGRIRKERDFNYKKYQETFTQNSAQTFLVKPMR